MSLPIPSLLHQSLNTHLFIYFKKYFRSYSDSTYIISLATLVFASTKGYKRPERAERCEVT